MTIPSIAVAPGLSIAWSGHPEGGCCRQSKCKLFHANLQCLKKPLTQAPECGINSGQLSKVPDGNPASGALTPSVGAPVTLVHGYANPLTIRRFVKLAESPKVLEMLPLVVSLQHGRMAAHKAIGPKW